MTDDAHLLRDHLDHPTGGAFTELVNRHLNVVYSAALRQVNGDVHLARDVTQLVFTDLARKAATLTDRSSLTGWLFVSTRFIAANRVRGERRRQLREQEAHLMSENESATLNEADWGRVRSVLDSALGDLRETDRDAILLRFFEGRSIADLAARFELNENTARMRIERALEKLRRQLARRGVTSTTSALALALANQAVIAAPPGLAATVAQTALAGAALAATGTGIGTATAFMGLSHLQIGITGTLILAGSGGLILQSAAHDQQLAELSALRREVATLSELRITNNELAQSLAEADRLRADDRELSRLREEAAALQRGFAEQARLDEANARDLETARRQATQFRETVLRARTTASRPDAADRLPQATFRVPPVYPPALEAAGVGGRAVVSFIVDSQGAVRAVLPGQSTHPEFEQAAVDAVKSWVFEAGIKGGRSVNTRMEVPVSFQAPSSGTPSFVEVGDPRPDTPIAWF
ncbi:MAG: TonB family protein [Opitutaceae bacterium]